MDLEEKLREGSSIYKFNGAKRLHNFRHFRSL